jgi:hypothetical protein
MSVPEMQPVSSSCISSVGYDAENQVVFVEFLNGSIYAYKGVPEHEFENLRTAPLVGSYFNRNFSGVYPYEHVDKHFSICVSDRRNSGAEVIDEIETSGSSSAERDESDVSEREAMQRQIDDLKAKVAELKRMLEDEKASSKALKNKLREALEKQANKATKKPSAKNEENAKRKAAKDKIDEGVKMRGAMRDKTSSSETAIEDTYAVMLELAEGYSELGVVSLNDFLNCVTDLWMGPDAEPLKVQFTAAWNQVTANANEDELNAITNKINPEDAKTIGRAARDLWGFVIRRDGLDAWTAEAAVHEILVDIVPELTRNETARAMVGVGIYSELSEGNPVNVSDDDDEELLNLVKILMSEDQDEAQTQAVQEQAERVLNDAPDAAGERCGSKHDSGR